MYGKRNLVKRWGKVTAERKRVMGGENRWTSKDKGHVERREKEMKQVKEAKREKLSPCISHFPGVCLMLQTIGSTVVACSSFHENLWEVSFPFCYTIFYIANFCAEEKKNVFPAKVYLYSCL